MRASLVVIQRRFYLLCLSLCFGVAASSCGSAQSAPTQMAPDEGDLAVPTQTASHDGDLALFRLVVDGATMSGAPGSGWLVSQWSEGCDLLELDYVMERLDGVQRETLDNFQGVNLESIDLYAANPSAFNYLSIHKETEYFGEGKRGWEGFRVDFPDFEGVITLSRPGYNLQKDQALICESQSRGWLDGVGQLVLLVKGEAGWEIVSALQLWIS